MTDKVLTRAAWLVLGAGTLYFVAHTAASLL
jgi:hypothetical protein